jgi:hypothetical protein
MNDGWGAWFRTKIHGSKGRCAAVAPRPSAGKIVSQLLFILAGDNAKLARLFERDHIRLEWQSALFLRRIAPK